MNCQNGATYLRQALNSVFNQSFESYEVIFWDDASTDASAKIAKSYGKKLLYRRGSGGRPLGESRNWALAMAKGQYVAILDCDDVWHPNKLAHQVAYLEAHPSVGLLASDCDFIDARGKKQGRFFGRVPFPDSENTYRRLLCGPNFLASPTLIWRRSVGLLCRPSFRFAELYELCVQIAKRYRIVALPQRLASYRLHPGQRGGAGCLGMTKEVLEVMGEHRAGAPLAQYVREGLLWARYGWQTLSHS
jgi:glycosyltransferase involved in cell wall biosynthesis